MRSRGVVGKRIVRIRQERTWDERIGEFYWNIQSLELEDGTRLQFQTREMEDLDYGLEGWAWKPSQPRRVDP